MLIRIIPLYVTAIANILLGLVLYYNKRKSYGLTYLIFAICIAGWAVTNGLYAQLDDAVALFPIALVSYYFAAMTALFFALFNIEYLMPHKKIKWPFAIAGMLIAPIFLIPGFLASSVNVQKSIITTNRLYVLAIFLAIYFLYGFYIIYKSYLDSRGIRKNQILLMFVGMLISISLAITSNLVLPFFHNYHFVHLGPAFTVIYLVIVAYAIVKHRLFDVRVAVARSVAFVLSLVTTGFIYGFIAFQIVAHIFIDTKISFTQQTVNTLLAIVLAFTFQPLRRFFEKITDKIFYRDKYDPQVVINSMGRILASEIRLDVLVREVTRELAAQLRLSSVDIVVVNEKSIYFQGQVTTAKNVQYKLADLKKLSRSQIVSDDLSSGERKEIMDKYSIGVSLAMRTSEAFVGYLLLGNKLSGDIYNDTDLKVLLIIADELAIAIQNAKSYAEIERFNETLQAKIDLATKKLRVANVNLKELDKAKDEFISMASHQLRTPLTTAKGYISMVLDGDFGRVDKSQLEPLGQALDSANRMAGLVSDLLNVSRMDAGKFFIDTRETDMVELVQGEFNGLKSMAASKNVRLSYTPPKQKIAPMGLDEDKTRQVVMNLIDNAIHYSAPPAGGGRVDVSFERDGQEVVFKVVDNGIGVPQKMQDKLFTKFYRAANAQATRPDGTGLGLYLVKRVVEDQGGELIFKSTEGHGSTFGFRMPIKSKSKSGTAKGKSS